MTVVIPFWNMVVIMWKLWYDIYVVIDNCDGIHVYSRMMVCIFV